MKRLSALLCISALLLLALPAAGANTRLAIGTLGLAPEDRNGDLSDLIAARLSATPNIELVERREMNKVLNEAGLSLSGIVRAKDAVHVGALLRADQFLLGTSVPISGTNRVIIRLVDARTGVIRAINIFRDSGSLDALAQDVTAFVNAEIEHPPQGRQDYLAIGVVQNLGVNNRFPDFPAQMRGYAAANLSGKVTILERDVISFLADEVRLDMAGLTKSGETQNPVQFGFWIVDGFYQSYEVAEPEVQLRLRVERVGGGQQNSLVQGKPNEKFLTKICESITEMMNHPMTNGVAPSRQGEIAALEARGDKLVAYRSRMTDLMPRVLFLLSAHNPQKEINTLDEAIRVYESILLLDPEKNAAKMRLAACLLVEGGYPDEGAFLLFTRLSQPSNRLSKEELAARVARAKDYYRQVISTSDPEYADDARIRLAIVSGGFEGVDMLRRFFTEATEPKRKKLFRDYLHDMLWRAELHASVETALPYLREQLFDELRDVEANSGKGISINLETPLFAYRFDPAKRERVINTFLPELLVKFPDLKPYILQAAAAEQTTTNSPVITQFLTSLKECQEHPETVRDSSSFFTHLTFTADEDKEASMGHTIRNSYQQAFDNHQYALIVRLALARQKAAEKGLAPPLAGKRRLAESYAALQQWKEALEVYNELPETPPQVKNECRSHLNLAAESETVPNSTWKDKDDLEKVAIAYDCIGGKQWLTAAAILDSMGHRTVRMHSSGPWGYAFKVFLPALVADECRAKAGKPPLSDPMRFEIGEPYVGFKHDGQSRPFGFEVEGENLWMSTYSQIKRFSGPGPFAAISPVEVHEFQRSNHCYTTSISVSPDYIWAGTEGDGLMEWNRRTGDCRRLTMNDGLLLDDIASLRLQGQTLWIAYRNGQNGGIGTLDIKSHKFSTFTPTISAAAGTRSENSYYQARLEQSNQAPRLLLSGMTEGEPGEMWFVVNDKGIQRFRNSDASWSTPWAISVQGINFSAIAANASQGQLLVTARDKGGWSTGDRERFGGLHIYDYRRNHRETLRLEEGLPSTEVTVVAADGRIAWVGGRGFVAVVDIQERKVFRVAFISANVIPMIQLDKTYAWIQVSCGDDEHSEYNSIDYLGNARAGVYRVERAKVEPTVFAVSQK